MSEFSTPPSSGGAAWGGITGTLSDQTDLQTALDGKADAADLLRSYLASTVTYNNVDTLADTALSVTVAAGGIYDIELVVHSTSANVALKMDFGGTATITNFIGQWFGGGNTGAPSHALSVTSAGTDFGSGDLDGVPCYYTFKGSVEINGAGTFLLRGAQNAADASDTTILRGSTLQLTKYN